MAGHSKWANIQHRKKAQDNKRGKLFTRLIREITVAARNGGSDPNSNPRLRLAIDKGLAANMTRETIERAAKRGAGELDGQQMDEIRYEGYAPGGVAIMVDCLTDNRNRTVAEVRHAFNKFNGNLGSDGSVAYLFNEQGILSYPPDADEEAVMEAALEAGAEDIIVNDDESIDVITTAADYATVVTAMESAGHEPADSEVTMRAETSVDIAIDAADGLIKLIDMLEELDDVQVVYSNADIPAAAYQNQ